MKKCRMRRIKCLLIISFYIVLSSLLNAQTNVKEVFTESWKKGNEQITIQTLDIKLTKANAEFEKEILAVSGKRYLLSVVKNPVVDLKDEHWKVMMNEITSDNSNNKDFCKDLLVADFPCDSGGDDFSEKNDIAYFYPSFNYENVNSKILQRNRIPAFSMNTRRKILVDGFLVVLKSGEIKFDENEKSKIKSLELIIELKNNFRE